MTGFGRDQDAVNRARQLVPYRKLVLVAAANEASGAAGVTANEALAHVDVATVRVPPDDFAACLAKTAEAVTGHDVKDTVRIHVAGGHNLVAHALLLTAFQFGLESFFCHARRITRLPVARSVSVASRFTPADTAVLAALPTKGDVAVPDLEVADMTPAAVKGTLLRLRGLRLVDADHRVARLTTTGAYYRRHVTAAHEP